METTNFWQGKYVLFENMSAGISVEYRTGYYTANVLTTIEESIHRWRDADCKIVAPG